MFPESRGLLTENDQLEELGSESESSISESLKSLFLPGSLLITRLVLLLRRTLFRLFLSPLTFFLSLP